MDNMPNEEGYVHAMELAQEQQRRKEREAAISALRTLTRDLEHGLRAGAIDDDPMDYAPTEKNRRALVFWGNDHPIQINNQVVDIIDTSVFPRLTEGTTGPSVAYTSAQLEDIKDARNYALDKAKKTATDGEHGLWEALGDSLEVGGMIAFRGEGRQVGTMSYLHMDGVHTLANEWRAAHLSEILDSSRE